MGAEHISLATPIIPTSTKVRGDLWEKAEALKKNIDSFRCAGDKIAQLEVQLVWAGHEERELGWRHAKPFLQAAERLAREADARMEACPPRIAEPAQPAPPALAAPAVLYTSLVARAAAAATKQAQTALPCETPMPFLAATKCPEPAPAAGMVLEPLPDSVHFALDKAEISAASAAVIERIAAAMNREPSLHIMLLGHADQRGDTPHNLKLSRRRAENVSARLLAAGIAAERITITALGKTRPLVLKRNFDGYARNRRVEFLFTLGPAQPVLHQQGDLQPE
jgi:outer membrane protein OmpA-like peptidoglycan-associated protein